jgi:hypothetical protein
LFLEPGRCEAHRPNGAAVRLASDDGRPPVRSTAAAAAAERLVFGGGISGGGRRGVAFEPKKATLHR